MTIQTYQFSEIVSMLMAYVAYERMRLWPRLMVRYVFLYPTFQLNFKFLLFCGG